jgi:hypothetical protein
MPFRVIVEKVGLEPLGVKKVGYTEIGIKKREGIIGRYFVKVPVRPG